MKIINKKTLIKIFYELNKKDFVLQKDLDEIFDKYNVNKNDFIKTCQIIVLRNGLIFCEERKMDVIIVVRVIIKHWSYAVLQTSEYINEKNIELAYYYALKDLIKDYRKKKPNYLIK